MKSDVYVGIDNGCSGTIGIIDQNGVGMQYPTPVVKTLNYQKTKANFINRVDVKKLKAILNPYRDYRIRCVIERPMVNPQRFAATTSALRALEATLIVLEVLGISFDYIDSKTWQKSLLPHISVKEKKEYPAKLKLVSKEVGLRKFPNVNWDEFKDADGLLMAYYCKITDIGVE